MKKFKINEKLEILLMLIDSFIFVGYYFEIKLNVL